MKKTRFVIACYAVMMLAMSGCSDIFKGGPQPVKPARLPEGYGAVRVSFNGGTARTAMPEVVLEAFSKIEFYFIQEGKATEETEPDTIYPKEGDMSWDFLLPAGTYTLLVKAYISEDDDDDILVAEGGIEGLIITAGNTNAVTVNLRPAQVITDGSGEGTLKITLDIQDNFTIDSLTMRRMFYYEDNDVLDLMTDVTGYPFPFNYQWVEKSGYYLLQMQIHNSTDDSYAFKTKVVHIYSNMDTEISYNIDDFNFISANFLVTNNGDYDAGELEIPGTLRYALQNADDGAIIKVLLKPGTVINLKSTLKINKNLIIEGNGVILDGIGAQGKNLQLMQIGDESGDRYEVKISRVHFMNGHSSDAKTSGGAINNNGNLTLESCIFSGNETDYSNGGSGGAIYNNGDMIVNGCTFYNNTGSYGGAIYNSSNSNLTLERNLFYGNEAYGPVVLGGNITSLGYNVVDAEGGINIAGVDAFFNKCGWVLDETDTVFTGLISGQDRNYGKVTVSNVVNLETDGYWAGNTGTLQATVKAELKEDSDGNSYYHFVKWVSEDKFDASRFNGDTDTEQTFIIGNEFRYAVFDGNGSPDAPKNVTNTDELAAIDTDEASLAGNYRLMADITLGSQWTPIGDYETEFIGTLDGNGYTINLGGNVQLSENDDGCFAGLFGIIGEDGKVENIKLLGTINVNYNDASSIYAGAVAGLNQGTIENVASNVTLNITSNSSYAGGIVGMNQGSISDCYSIGAVTSNVTDTGSAGGIVGQNGGEVRSCWARGNISINLVGITADYYLYAGGIAGSNYDGSISSCVALNGSITATVDNVGRIVGKNDATAGTLTGNYANSAMLVNDETRVDGSTSDKNGEPFEGWEKVDWPFDGDPWVWDEANNRPKLWFE